MLTIVKERGPILQARPIRAPAVAILVWIASEPAPVLSFRRSKRKVL
jgi:hypothetical protein